VGPDLVNLTKQRDRAWVARYLTEPDKMLADGDPIAKKLFAKYRGVRMPNLGLDRDEIDALLQHIEKESRAAPAGSKASSSTVGTVSPRG